MEKTLQERLTKLISTLGFDKDILFARHVGISGQSLSNYLTGRVSSPSMNLVEKIVTAIPELNARWLITGEGQVLNHNQRKLIESTPQAINEPEIAYSTRVEILELESKYLTESLAAKDKLLASRDELIEALQRMSRQK
jgi:transcriptional regulator with XRE-family HTH domain